jgi:hypothetical protein
MRCKKLQAALRIAARFMDGWYTDRRRKHSMNLTDEGYLLGSQAPALEFEAADSFKWLRRLAGAFYDHLGLSRNRVLSFCFNA